MTKPSRILDLKLKQGSLSKIQRPTKPFHQLVENDALLKTPMTWTHGSKKYASLILHLTQCR